MNKILIIKVANIKNIYYSVLNTLGWSVKIVLNVLLK